MGRYSYWAQEVSEIFKLDDYEVEYSMAFGVGLENYLNQLEGLPNKSEKVKELIDEINEEITNELEL